MGTSNNAGFTIIETVLFLAITGMLIAGLLVGVGVSLNIQRYRDSVTSLKSFLQSQYSAVINVENSRDNSWKCDNSGATSQGNGSLNRGQSDCIVIGRYIVIDQGNITVTAVNAYPPEKITSTGTDIATLKSAQYTLGLSTISQETSALEWGTVIAWPVAGSGVKIPTTPRSIAILIIRSPESGSVYTFTADSPPPLDSVTSAVLKSMLITGTGNPPSQQQRTICVDSQGLVLSGNMAVFIHEYASSETAIETRSNEVIQSLGGTTRC